MQRLTAIREQLQLAHTDLVEAVALARASIEPVGAELTETTTGVAQSSGNSST